MVVTGYVEDAQGRAARWRSWRRGVYRGLGLVCGCVVLGVVGGVVGVAPAGALPQRGHVFRFAFGGADGGFVGPSAVAVDEVDGDVFVADRGNDRVEVFEPVFEAGVNGSEVLVGERFVRSWSVPAPEAVAVDSSVEGSDPSRGDVYVVGSTVHELKREEPDRRIYKFGPEGTLIGVLKSFAEPGGEGREPFEEIQGVAVDETGGLYVYEAGTIDVLSDATRNRGVFSLPAPDEATRGFALGAGGELYAAHVSENPLAAGLEGEPAVVGVEEGLTGKLLEGELDEQPSSAVAVNLADVPANLGDERGDAYVANVESVGGRRVSAVAAFSPSGGLMQRFTTAGLSEASGVAVDDQSGAVFVTDAAADEVDVFVLEEPGAPSVEGLSACAAVPVGSSAPCPKTPGAWMLEARVNPDGAPTHVHFEYGRGACALGGCTRSTETELGAAAGESFTAQPVSTELQGLTAGAYHYRVAAGYRPAACAEEGSECSCTVEGGECTVYSSERTFSVAAAVAGLPDGRAWELVSPVLKDGAEAEAITKEGGAIQAAAGGGAISYVADGPMPAGSRMEGSRNPELTQVLSVRTPEGWVTQDISTANSAGTGIHPGRAQEYQLFSSDLALALLEPFPGDLDAGTLAEPPLSPPVQAGERQQKTFYERADAPVAPGPAEAGTYALAQRNGQLEGNAGFVALVDEADALGVLGSEFGGGEDAGVELLDANSDLSAVAFQSYRAAPGLYEWQSGRVYPVSVLDGQLTSGVLGLMPNARNAVSSDGSRVFWSAGGHLYVTDPHTGEALQLDRVVSGAGGGQADAVFQTASVEGNRVFFTDTQRLTAPSKSGEGAGHRLPDLYVYELAEGSPLSGRLTDLTPEGIYGESAGVVEGGSGGGVLGASEDGSYVYFVANGALTGAAARGDCVTGEEVVAGRSCNLYVEHHSGGGWEAPSLVAVLANEDAPDWGGAGQAGDLARMTSRVSPDGRYLAFMSRRSLTGYDNEDKTSTTPGERVDEEVYLYDAQTQSLACASCEPDGERPEGIFDPGERGQGGTEGIGLLVDRPGIWNAGVDNVDHWLAGSIPGWTGISVERALYQSRYLSNSGRLFFNSPQQLAGPPETDGGKERVYEYEPDRVGGCTSEGGCVGLISSTADEHEAAFLDAGENGNDVFFLTRAKLSPQDSETNFSVYDAHVCETASPCTQPSVQEVQHCLETPASPCKTPTPIPGESASSYASEASLAPEQSASVQVLSSHTQQKPKPKPLTRQQKLAKALSACRHEYKGTGHARRRAACETAARKRYAPKPGKTPAKAGKR